MAENDTFINPKTGRKIKVGSALYKKIMKQQAKEEKQIIEEDQTYNEEEYVSVPDLQIFIKKTSVLYNTLSLIREYDSYRNSLVLNLKEESSEMDPLWKDLYRIGSCHELWQSILLQCHPSQVSTLRIVNTFSNKTLLQKYPLEEWIDWGVWKWIRECYKEKLKTRIIIAQPRLTCLENRVLQNKLTVVDFRKFMDKWWKSRGHKSFPYEEVKPSSFHVAFLHYCAKRLITISVKVEDYIQEIDELTLLCCRFSVSTYRHIFFRGVFRFLREKLRTSVPDGDIIIIDKRSEQRHGPQEFYLKTHIPNTYLHLRPYNYSNIEVTEYFQDIFK